MPAITITLDGVDLKDIPLTKARTTLGRRPYNDIVMDHLAVSGEHAVFVLHDDGVELQDLHSTNGTYVNGKAIVSARIGPQDHIEIGRYRIRLVGTGEAQASARAPLASAHAGPAPTSAAVIQVLSGPAAGREMALTKVVTTLGKPGVAVASITRKPEGYAFSAVDGEHRDTTVNGHPLGNAPVLLQSGDTLTLAGTTMKFLAVPAT